MKQKTILTITFLSLLSLAVFVSAMPQYTQEGSDSVRASYRLESGWNLIPTEFLNFEQWRETNTPYVDKIKAVWIYDYQNEEYFGGEITLESSYPGHDYISFNNEQDNLKYERLFSYPSKYEYSNVAWVYVKESFTIGYPDEFSMNADNSEFYGNDLDRIQDVRFNSGWNFFYLSYNIFKTETSFEDYFQNCNIRRIVTWDTSGNNWEEISTSEFLNMRVETEVYYLPLIIYMDNSCSLDYEEGVSNPPTLPN